MLFLFGPGRVLGHSTPFLFMDPLLGEIRLMALNFPPRGWAFCQGQLMAISQNTALFSLLGTTYGGDGRTTFALPDLRGRTGMGQNPATYPLGTMTGTETVTLAPSAMPAHTHTLSSTVPVSTTAGTATSPAGGFFAQAGAQYGDSADGGNMAATLLNGSSTPAGGSQPHENRMPFLVLNYCIALQGDFPIRP
jgi:microcystin-dependent protein